MKTPVAPEVDPGEYDERRQAPAVSRDVLDRSNQGFLIARASVGLIHLDTFKVLGGSNSEHPLDPTVTIQIILPSKSPLLQTHQQAQKLSRRALELPS